MNKSPPMDSGVQRLYGRRKGRPLRNRKSQLMRDLLPSLQIVLPSQKKADPISLFPFSYEALWLEIGFGGGEHLATQAAAHPRVAFIGCEPFINGVASALDHIDRLSLSNIRIFSGDARLLLEALPAVCIQRCFLLFADPWPKTRHAERRFLNQDNLKWLAKVMKPGAQLRLATDDPGLQSWTRAQLALCPDFDLYREDVMPPSDWVETRYEQKGIAAGRRPVYFDCRRATTLVGGKS